MCPELFQCVMTDLLKEEEGCKAIIKSAEEYDGKLQKTFQIIKESGLILNKEKCELKKDKLTYFGHVLSADGLSPDPDTVKAIRELQVSTNEPELRRVIGMINYLGRFIPNLATGIHPMTSVKV